MRNLINFLLKYNHWLLFILLEVISFALLVHFNNYQGSVYFTSANRIGGAVYETVNQVTRYFGLVDVNRDLTARNVELEIEVERLTEALEHYTQDSTKVTELRQTALSGYTLYPARVINNNVTHPNNFITIDKGKADGIKPEMGVVCGNGVVGIVYLTGTHHSIVLPVLNSQSNISCKIKRTSYFGFLRWEGGSPQYAYVKDMPRHSEFSLGDTIVTSGHSAVFPAGIPIGTVDDMKDSHDGLSYLLKIKLFTDFARLSDVQVIESAIGLEQKALEDSVKAITSKQ